MADWFRKVSWTKSDQEDFWAHYKRARSSGKAQYLRIQAVHLAATNKPDLRNAALGLLNLLIAEFPDPIQLPLTYAQRAEIHVAEGRVEEAISDFREAIAREREFKNIKSGAWLDFGWLVITTEKVGLFDEVLGVLQERESGALFPVEHYRLNAIRSIIAADRGDLLRAQKFAEEALQQAARSHSGLRYHATLGLVSEKRGPILDRLQKIQKG